MELEQWCMYGKKPDDFRPTGLVDFNSGAVGHFVQKPDKTRFKI